MKKLFKILDVLAVIGAAVGGGLYYAYPVQVSTLAGLTRNYVISLAAPAGSVTTEMNAGAAKGCCGGRLYAPRLANEES